MNGRVIEYRTAINEAISGEMKADPTVFVFGPDVADHKKSYGVTVNLVEFFGEESFSVLPCLKKD